MYSLGLFTSNGISLASLGVPILLLLDILALREEGLSFVLSFFFLLLSRVTLFETSGQSLELQVPKEV